MKYQRIAIEKESPEEVGSVISLNLSESAISDQTLDSLGITIPPGLLLTYTEHRGTRSLRALVAQTSSRNGSLTPDHVLVTAGASASLFIVNTALLGPHDHMVVTRPNYATNLEVPRSIGCDFSFVYLEFESRFRLDVDRVASAVRPGVTKLISVCSPNNPTGTAHTSAELESLARLAKDKECYLLVDETYADLDLASDEEKATQAAACLGDHVITVSSMSKVYGVPGIRIGWIITTSPALRQVFLAAKEQISICGSVLDELAAEQILARRAELLSRTIPDMRRRRDCVAAWVDRESELVEWVRPVAGVMCFIGVKTPPGGMDAFYKRLLEGHGAYVGRGTWFERRQVFPARIRVANLGGVGDGSAGHFQGASRVSLWLQSLGSPRICLASLQ